MVSAVRVGAVVSRRISAAMRRGDAERAKQLQRLIEGMNNGRATPGMVLIELQDYRKNKRHIYGKPKRKFDVADVLKPKRRTDHLRGGLH